MHTVTHTRTGKHTHNSTHTHMRARTHTQTNTHTPAHTQDHTYTLSLWLSEWIHKNLFLVNNGWDWSVFGNELFAKSSGPSTGHSCQSLQLMTISATVCLQGDWYESPCVLSLYVCVLQAVVAKSFLRNIPTGWLPCFGCPVEMIPIENQQRKEKRVGTMTYRSESCFLCMHA